MPARPARPARRRRGSFAIAALIGLAALLGVAPAAQATEARWLDVELYYLDLLNCTRTGGWVKVDGTCKGGVGEYSDEREPLRRHVGISNNVARPYSKVMADAGESSHYLDGGPLDRLERAGYDPGAWGESIGYWSGDPYEAVTRIHRNYQSEKPYKGIHRRLLKKAAFKSVGIGVWRKDGYTYLVMDFYAP